MVSVHVRVRPDAAPEQQSDRVQRRLLVCLCYLRSLFINSRYEFLPWEHTSLAFLALPACCSPEAFDLFCFDLLFTLHTHTFCKDNIHDTLKFFITWVGGLRRT